MADRVEDVRLPRMAKGKRSYFYKDPEIDRMMTFLLEMMAEFSSMRERLDTVERLLESKSGITREDIEAYQPDAEVEAERSAWNQAFIRRVMRLSESRDE